MSVYEIDGSELNKVYDIGGDELSTAYDIDGDIVYTATPKEYAITNVVSYFRQDTEDVADELNALSSDWQSFVFLTDTHGSGNKQHSQAIAMYLMANTPATMLFMGGDYCQGDWVETQYDTYFEPFITNGFDDELYPVIGNHERFGAELSALDVIYEDFLESKSKLKGNPSKFYYYFDKASKKTRYMFINTSNDLANGMTQTQIDWIAQNVILPASDWNLVVIGHIDIDASNITGQWKSAKASEITSAISLCNGHIVGYFCGHEHIDQLRLVNSKFYQLISLCDLFENDNYFEVDNYPTRTNGTDTEQVVTVVSFNTQTGIVQTRRIGAGAGSGVNEYTWNYKTLQVT